MIHRYLFADFWVPIWPNLAASLICSAAVYLKLHFEAVARHEELKRHVTKMANSGGKGAR